MNGVSLFFWPSVAWPQKFWVHLGGPRPDEDRSSKTMKLSIIFQYVLYFFVCSRRWSHLLGLGMKTFALMSAQGQRCQPPHRGLRVGTATQGWGRMTFVCPHRSFSPPHCCGLITVYDVMIYYILPTTFLTCINLFFWHLVLNWEVACWGGRLGWKCQRGQSRARCSRAQNPMAWEHWRWPAHMGKPWKCEFIKHQLIILLHVHRFSWKYAGILFLPCHQSGERKRRSHLVDLFGCVFLMITVWAYFLWASPGRNFSHDPRCGECRNLPGSQSSKNSKQMGRTHNPRILLVNVFAASCGKHKSLWTMMAALFWSPDVSTRSSVAVVFQTMQDHVFYQTRSTPQFHDFSCLSKIKKGWRQPDDFDIHIPIPSMYGITESFCGKTLVVSHLDWVWYTLAKSLAIHAPSGQEQALPFRKPVAWSCTQWPDRIIFWPNAILSAGSNLKLHHQTDLWYVICNVFGR